MKPPADPLYGKTIDLPLTPGKSSGIRVAFLCAIPVIFLVVPSLMKSQDPRLSLVFVLGLLLVPLCGYAAWSIHRAGGWTDCRFRLTRKSVTIPLYPVHRRRSRILALDDLSEVGLGMVGQFPAIRLTDQEGTYLVPYDWFPPDWDHRYVAWRTQLRWELRRMGKRLKAVQLAAVEAQLDHIDAGGNPGIAAVVLRGEAGPEVLSTLGADGSRRLPDGTVIAPRPNQQPDEDDD